MTRSRTSLVVIACLFLFALPASGEWFDDYEAGLKAARNRDWATVISRMNQAIGAKPTEGAREKTYGMIFIKYYPYYYRGIAYFEQGNFAAAQRDLERTRGVGALDLGTTDSYLRKIEAELRTPDPPPPPPPTTTTTTTAPPVPTETRRDPPVVPPVVTTTTTRTVVAPPVTTTTTEDVTTRTNRERARAVLNDATASMNSARQRGADRLAAQQFNSGVSQLSTARSQASRAATASEWQRVADTAEGARLAFIQALAIVSNPTVDPTEVLLAELRKRLRSALDSYFSGRFSEATTSFERLASEQPENAMLWAFLGASIYSEYYIGGEVNAVLRRDAEAAFRQAKKRLKELDPRYFSPRIRAFYATVR